MCNTHPFIINWGFVFKVPPETPLDGILPDESPMVMRPSPLAIRIIEKFLHEKKVRLVDLFKRADKDKDWKLSRDEFRQAVTGVSAWSQLFTHFMYL